jgi:MFS family permease
VRNQEAEGSRWNSVPKRNIAFASMGGGQPVGFGLGTTLGGIIADKLGWQWGFYISSIIAGLVWALSIWQMPQSSQALSWRMWQRLKDEIDWVGIAIASISLGMLSYVLACGISSPVLE